MDLVEARKIDGERAARERREKEAAEALLAAQRVEEEKRAHEAKLRSVAAEIKEAEGAQAAFKAAADALAPLSDAVLARCGTSGNIQIPASTVLPSMLSDAALQCSKRLLRLREKREALTKKA